MFNKRVVLIFIFTISLNSSTSFDDGVSLFNEKSYDEAYLIFNQLFEDGHKIKNLDNYLGKSAFETGRYYEALSTYERILIEIEGVNKSEENRVKLEIAKINLVLEEKESAKKLLLEVLESDPPLTVSQNIEAILAKLNKKKMEKSVFKGYLNIRFGYEENINSQPNEESIIEYLRGNSVKGKKVDSLFLEETATLFFGYNISEKFAVQTNILGYNQNFSEDSDFDITYLAFQITPLYRPFETYRFEVPISLDTIYYGNEHLLNSYSGGVMISKIFDTQFFQNLLMSVFTNYKRKLYEDEYKDLNSDIFEYGLGFNLRRRDHSFSFKYSSELESAEHEQTLRKNLTDKTINNIKTKYLVYFGNLNFSLLYSLRNVVYDDYEAEKIIGFSDGARTDRLHTFKTEFGYEMVEGLSLLFGYSRVINNSNHLPVSYTNNRVDLGVNYRW